MKEKKIKSIKNAKCNWRECYGGYTLAIRKFCYLDGTPEKKECKKFEGDIKR